MVPQQSHYDQRKTDSISQFQHFMANSKQPVSFPRTYQVTDQRTRRRRKRIYDDKKQSRHTAGDIGNSQFHPSQMFYGYKKQKPGHNTDKSMQHTPHRQTEQSPQ